MKKGSVGFLLVLISLFFTFPVGMQADESGTVRIEGVVRDLTSGTPMAPVGSVDVIVNGWMIVHSGRDGEWNITGLKPGQYTVELGLPLDHYTLAQQRITVDLWNPGTTERVDLSYYQGAAPADTAAGAPAVVPPMPAIPDPLLVSEDGALVAPPLIAGEAKTELDANQAVSQAVPLNPELDKLPDQDQTITTENGPSLTSVDNQIETESEGGTSGEEIPGLGGAGPRPAERHPYFGLRFVGVAMTLGLVFVFRAWLWNGGRNVE
jgi:hypothetical protein